MPEFQEVFMPFINVKANIPISDSYKERFMELLAKRAIN